MDQKLLNSVQRYLHGNSTLRDLESWVLSNLQRILDSGDEQAIDWANQIDADLIEFSEGLIDEATIRDHLHRLVSTRDTILVLSDEIITALSTVSYATVDDQTIRNSFNPVPVS